MRRDDADVEQLQRDIEILRALIRSCLDRPHRGNYALRGSIDLLRERRERLARINGAA